MNYYQAREILTKEGGHSGKWHWTCMNDGEVWRGACCASCEGHASAEEAEECHRKYVVAGYRIDGPVSADVWPKHKCEVKDCQGQGTMLAHAPGMSPSFHLCAAHANAQTVDGLVPRQTSVISSY